MMTLSTSHPGSPVAVGDGPDSGDLRTPAVGSRRSAGRVARLAAVLLAVVTLAGACSSDDGSEAGDSPGNAAAEVADGQGDAATGDGVDTAADSAPGSIPQAADAVGLEGAELEEYLARRYEAYWDAYDAARGAPTASPETDFPALGDLAAGEQLEASYDTLRRMAEQGEAIREPEAPAIEGIDANSEHRVRIEMIDGTLAEISGCVVNDDVRHQAETGDILSDSVATVLSTSTMALTDGQWKLIRSRAVDIQDGVTGCWDEGEAAFPW